MKNSRYAFTMIELIFVIVVLGILASVAIPKLTATRTDAEVAKGRADVASVRSGIVTERQARLIKGDSAYISGIKLNNGGLFGGILLYPKTASSGNGQWSKVGTDINASSTLTYKAGNIPVTFKYYRNNTTVGTVVHKAGTFSCSTTTGTTAQKEMCKNLIN